MEGHAALAILTLLSVSVSSCSASGRVSYNVSPYCADSDPSCHTLVEIFSENNNSSLSDSELVFLPGKHSLVGVSVTVADIENFTLVTHDTASILCANSLFVFSNVTNLSFLNLELISCSIKLSAVSVVFNHISFINGSAYQGGAIAIYNESNVSFSGQTLFVGNHADFAGGAVFSNDSYLSFSDNVTFRNNWSGPRGGGAVFAASSDLQFTGIVTFTENNIITGNSTKKTPGSEPCTENYGGGALHVVSESTLVFDGSTSFSENNATSKHYGGGIHICDSSMKFKGNTDFLNNLAHNGNGIFADYSNISFVRNVHFSSKYPAFDKGGAIDLNLWCNLVVEGNASFVGNSADLGGALHMWHNNSVEFNGPLTTFTANSATRGGAIRVSQYDNLTFRGITEFKYNDAKYKGGAIDLDHYIRANFHGNTTFYMNTASRGGAIVSLDFNFVTFYDGNHNFLYNSADLGGAINSKIGSEYNFSGETWFMENNATVGAGFYMTEGKLNMNGSMFFVNNTARYLGGGLAIDESSVILEGYTRIINNSADSGGGIFAQNTNLILKGDGLLLINTATGYGGALYATGSLVHFHGTWNVSINKQITEAA